MPRPHKPASPFRYFNSSPEVIRLVVMMYVKLGGEMVYLWRAVDQEGEILESFVTKSRDKLHMAGSAWRCY
jgi:transposase-like protein